MKYKDIVNRDLVTLTNCEHEPIHIPGSIQPHGFLIAIQTGSWVVDYCSGNLHAFTGISFETVLGKRFGEVFGDEIHIDIEKYIDNKTEMVVLPLEVILFEKRYLLTAHQTGKLHILEFEPFASQPDQLSEIYANTVKFVSYMNDSHTLQALFGLVAEGTREITGYDRVMIYRFDAEYNGEIFAESCNDDLEPFLGLHYPHTDIPAQARELYMKNLVRLIADVKYIPVPLYTIDTGEIKSLDLSLSTLRSTSPIHVEYLTNMGVEATLTISLIHKGRLWGLIACHHYTPKKLRPDALLAAQLQGKFITSQIDVRQSNEEYDIARKTNTALEKLNALHFPEVFDSLAAICAKQELLDVCNAEGVAVFVDGRIYKNGLTPTDENIKLYSKWFSVRSNDTTFHTTSQRELMPELQTNCELVSGILYYSLGNGNSIMWYRPERIAEILWAGDPEKAIIRDHLGMHPRNSFNLWREIVKCKSAPWLQPELHASANYAHTLQKKISIILLTIEEERFRTVNEVLKETNAELENINWISTHDLQEPLRKIQLIASQALHNNTEDIPSIKMIESLEKMTKSANRMQTLLVDIMKYTQIKYAQDAFEKVNLNDVMTEILIDMEELINDKQIVIHFEILPEVIAIPFLMKQLFSNIILNAVKYASAERSPVITITTSVTAEKIPHLNYDFYHTVVFSDNGIGFEQEYAESIFKIFTRLHGQSEYNGSGVGLALCKKIMQTSNGFITAKGIPGEGASFTLHFPVI